MDKYVPISCEFHDRLEAWATTRAECTIEFVTVAGTRESQNSIIEDVFACDGKEFILLTNGDRIRLDRIESVNGHRLPK